MILHPEDIAAIKEAMREVVREEVHKALHLDPAETSKKATKKGDK